MRQLLPTFPPKEPSRNDIVHLFLSFHHSVVSAVCVIELSMQICIEDLKPFNNLLQVDVCILSVKQKLFGVTELEVIGCVEG